MRINSAIADTNKAASQKDNVTKKKPLSLVSNIETSSSTYEDAAKVEMSEGTKNKTSLPAKTLENIQNGVSLLQAADQDLDKIRSMLERGKELAAQAATSQDAAEKERLQNEINNINHEIDNYKTTYSSDPNNEEIMTALKSDWLEVAEDVIQERYGLVGDGAELQIVLDEDSVPYLAAIMYNYDKDGKAINQTMHIAVKSALPAALPNGGRDPGQYDDRVVTHEMVHVLMGRTMNFQAMPNWFKEGTAEFIHGPNERVALDLKRSGGGMKGATALQDALGDGTNSSWENTSLHYSAASMAVRYLHTKIKEDGYSGGIKDLMTDLKSNPTESLDQALNHVSRYSNVKAFVNDYVKNGNGAAFIHNLDAAGEFRASLAGGDTGAIGGSTVDGGPVQTAESVIPDINHPTETPLENFRVIWPTRREDPIPYQANKAATIQSSTGNYTPLKVDSHVLGTDQIDLVNHSDTASALFDKAISYITDKQAQLGEIKNNLSNQESIVVENANSSAITDSNRAEKEVEQVKASLEGTNANNASKIARLQPERVLQLLKTS
ncbi:flagellinolysin [Pelosinus propionicus]|uniref:Flagellin n=1 Tax=Pelosinus propionicus DSM 13327 TaxID=1123291 RepID=A0A1I4IBH5_9FIRM|nr:flagellinolysin [Pelosinus propionicus]SFL51635.1 flagellin [Pelosinus propionicus DSM 13327]